MILKVGKCPTLKDSESLNRSFCQLNFSHNIKRKFSVLYMGFFSLVDVFYIQKKKGTQPQRSFFRNFDIIYSVFYTNIISETVISLNVYHSTFQKEVKERGLDTTHILDQNQNKSLAWLPKLVLSEFPLINFYLKAYYITRKICESG